MHAYLKRMLAVEASGWEPVKKRQVKKTAVIHTAACGLKHRRQFCNCAAEIICTLRDGRRFSIDSMARRCR